MDTARFLEDVKSNALREFSQKKLILAFREFLELFAAEPVRLGRTAPQYLADVLAHFGTEMVPGLGGRPTTRYKLFDAAFDGGERPVFGQETVQQDIAARVRSFAQAGKANRLILVHGPNGSSKTSLIDCLFRAMENYSRAPEGALYSFNWVFVDREESTGRMGFERGPVVEKGESLAHVDGKEISCRIPCEMHDNPIFLVPPAERAGLLDALAAETADPKTAEHLRSDALRRGAMCPKCRQIYDTLLAAYGGDWQRVCRHVQVERFFISRRYREGAVSIQPQGVIDAGVEPYMPERGPGLPAVLLGLQLYAPSGDLIDANRGMVEYSDVLKRHMEANKYLLTTAERGTASLPRYEAHLDLVMAATANEQQLTAFKAHPDFNSFRGRLELVPCPYLLEYGKEARIYREFLARSVRGKHVAPHVDRCAALWAVLTRLRRPDGDRFEGALASAVRKLKPIDKARLYDSGRLPTGLDERERRELAGAVAQLPAQFREQAVEFEGQVWMAYEGAFGASPREMQLVLADAASNHGCLTPLKLLGQIEELVRQTSTYDFLRLDADGDYFKPAEFVETVREDYYQMVWRETSSAAGIVEEAEYQRLLRDYFVHVRAFVSGDKVQNPANGRWEPANQEFMRSVEAHLSVEGETDDFRRSLVTKAAAWSLDHPGEKLDPLVVFSEQFDALRLSFLTEHRKTVRTVLQSVLRLGTDDERSLSAEQRARAEAARKSLLGAGYCQDCLKEVAAFVLKRLEED